MIAFIQRLGGYKPYINADKTAKERKGKTLLYRQLRAVTATMDTTLNFGTTQAAPEFVGTLRCRQSVNFSTKGNNGSPWRTHAVWRELRLDTARHC